MTKLSSVLAAVAASLFLAVLANPAEAMSRKQTTDKCSYTNEGRVICMGKVVTDRQSARASRRVAGKTHRGTFVRDASGNSVVRSSKGVSIRVAPSARTALQCVVDYVEARGVRIKSMRGYGPGTVRASLHPSGRAIDINQTSRDVTRPVVPRAISNAAADKCGVISGARWGYADNGHWNLAIHGRTTQEPWPRIVRR